MRFRLPIGRTLFFLAAFMVALLALLPMRLGIDWLGLGTRGLAAREVAGSIWFGSLKEAQYGSVGIGDVHAGLRGLPLLLGRARVAMERDSGTDADAFDGAATVTRRGFGFDDVDGWLQLAGAFGPLPLTQVDLGDVSVHFADGQCQRASGSVRAAVAGDIAGIALPGGLTGTARCDAGALLLPLVSQAGSETLNLKLFGDGRYEAQILMRGADPTLAPRFAAAGFAVTPAGYALTVGGEL